MNDIKMKIENTNLNKLKHRVRLFDHFLLKDTLFIINIY